MMLSADQVQEATSPRVQPTAEPNPLISAEREKAESTPVEKLEQTLYLAGRPTLKQYLRFMKNNAAEPVAAATLTDQWNAANEHIRVLEKDEAGAADNPAITKLGQGYDALLRELLKDPLIQNGFNSVPTEIALIDLGRAVVYQKHIDLEFVARLRKKLEPAPTRDQIFRTCLPYDHPQPPVKWSRHHRNSFVFVSPSNDLRYLGTMKLHRENIKNYPPPGDLVGVIGLAVGFGSNFLNGFYAENRLVIHNGSHRAYTLFEMGITHVPCIIQHVANRHELNAIAASEIMEDPDYYLRSPRPPMLKDYFNPKLRTIIKTRPQLRQVTVKFEVDDGFIPSF